VRTTIHSALRTGARVRTIWIIFGGENYRGSYARSKFARGITLAVCKLNWQSLIAFCAFLALRANAKSSTKSFSLCVRVKNNIFVRK